MEKKKNKSKTKEDNSGSGPSKEGPSLRIFKNYLKEMEEKTEEFQEKNPDLDAKFYLFQTIQNKNSLRDMIFNLTYFYDNNFVGNRDFVHVPSMKNIMDNILKYPIMLVTRKDENGMDDILGASTIKIENNRLISDNPYFPTAGENILTITGILSKQNVVDKNQNRVKGIGKELFKSAIRAAYNVNRQEKVRLICEVDCRNTASFNSVSKAVKELQNEGLNVGLNLDGYYEILKNDGELTEAPTFVLEICLNDYEIDTREKIEFNYLNCKSTNLFTELNEVIERNTDELKQYVNVKDNKTIIYHNVKNINALNMTLNVGNTADGNERIPEIKALEYVNS